MGPAAALGRPDHARFLGVLKGPCYAGAYEHGRYTSRRTVEPDGTVRTGLVQRPRFEWPILIPDRHDGYIVWVATSRNDSVLELVRVKVG